MRECRRFCRSALDAVRLREVTIGGTALERYRYDAHGRRIIASRLSGPADTIGVIFSQYAGNRQLLFQENLRSAVNKDIDSLYLAVSLIAQREVPVGGGSASLPGQQRQRRVR